MNKEQFFSYINSPEKLDNASLEEVSQLINDFPYFQSVHLLYIKNLFNRKDIKFDNQLKLASLYSSNRDVLYNLINDIPENEIIEDKNMSKLFLIPQTLNLQLTMTENLKTRKEALKPNLSQIGILLNKRMPSNLEPALNQPIA